MTDTDADTDEQQQRSEEARRRGEQIDARRAAAVQRLNERLQRRAQQAADAREHE